MQGDEIRALRRLQREQGLSSHVFMTERDEPMTPKAFHTLSGGLSGRTNETNRSRFSDLCEIPALPAGAHPHAPPRSGGNAVGVLVGPRDICRADSSAPIHPLMIATLVVIPLLIVFKKASNEGGEGHMLVVE